jgi:hypothetical protein
LRVLRRLSIAMAWKNLARAIRARSALRGTLPVIRRAPARFINTGDGSRRRSVQDPEQVRTVGKPLALKAGPLFDPTTCKLSRQ